MHIQSVLLACSVTLAGLAAAQYGPQAQNLHYRRAAAILDARDAIADIEYYDTILKRDAAASYDSELYERDAEADFEYFEDLVARDAQPDHYHYARAFGSKIIGGGKKQPAKDGEEKKEEPKKVSQPPRIPKLKRCSLCREMCTIGENFHVSPLHAGFHGMCVDLPGQEAEG